MDIKIVEAFLKRVIKAADKMEASIIAGDSTNDWSATDLQIIAQQYGIAKKLFVHAAKEYHEHAADCNHYHQEICSLLQHRSL